MKRLTLVSALLAVLAVSACKQQSGDAVQSADPATAPPSAQPREPRVLSIPGQGTPAPEGQPTGSPVLRWTVPDAWTEEPPANNARWAQYRVSGSGGDGECVVFYFGRGQGGDPQANARRWAGQFTQPDGSPSEASMRVTSVDGGSVPIQLVEVAGTYDGGMVSVDTFPGYMLLGGIAQGPDAPWFFKFIGPEATIREQRGAFLELLRSVRVDG